MTWTCIPARSAPPRVLLVSQRLVNPELSRCLRFEFEDAAAALDVVDLLAPDRQPVVSRTAGLAWAGVARVLPAAARLLGGGLEGVRRRYDLVLVTVQGLEDLLPLEPVLPYLRRGRVNACCVDEVWRNGLPRRTGELRLLKKFDVLFCTMEGSVELLAKLTGRPCHFLPPSTDALALCPWPSPPERAIHVYSMGGRRSPEMHAALLALAERSRAFYLYDTVGNARTPDFREHRRHLGDLLRRTRFFVSYPGKVDVPGQTGGQQEFGFRYFEGAAAGTVIVGEAPASPSFDRLFGWEDSVVRLPYGSRAVESCLAALEADPERVSRIRRANVLESLARHDHAHRWMQILDAVGLARLPATGARLEALRARAALVRGLSGIEDDAPQGRPRMA
jgi:glycosyl transferase family 1